MTITRVNPEYMARNATTGMGGSDLDDMEAGECWWGNNLVNAPEGSTAYFMVSMQWLYQTAYRFVGNSSEPEVYVRSRVNNVWQPWVRLVADKTESTTAVASIIAANAANATVNGAVFSQQGRVAHIGVSITNAAAIAVPSSGAVSINVGTVVSGKRPNAQATLCGSGMMATLATSGVLTVNYIGGAARTIAAKAGTWMLRGAYMLP